LEFILYQFLRYVIEIFFIIFVLLNLTTFFLYVIDKRQALKNKWRISEFTLISFTLMCGGIGAFLGMHFSKHKIKKIKFKIVLIFSLIITLIPMIHIVHSLTLDRIIRYAKIEFRSESWPAELDGYRIAFMTDMHTITDESMRKVAEELNKRNIDLLLLGGDFDMRNYQNTLREIAEINTTNGIFGVEGNHDDYVRLFAAKERHGIMPLDNNGTHIHSGFYLAGVRDNWNRISDIEESVAGANENDFILLVAHNPDISMMQPTAGIDLIIAGHMHGGHITFFCYPSYLLRGSITDYGTRFGRGFSSSADGVPVFTSSGIGPYFTAPRIFARPEVVIFTMYNE